MNAADFDTWGIEDRVHYIYKPANELNCEMIVQVAQLDNISPYAQGGIMFRETLEMGSKHASIFLTGDKRKIMRERIETDGTTNQKPLSTITINSPYWLKMVRNGNTFSGYFSTNGTDWNLERTVNLELNQNFFVGLASASHDFTKSAIIKYKDIQFSTATNSKPDVNILQTSFYPNPVNNTLFIDGINNYSKIVLYNSLGKKVLLSRRQPIDVSNLQSGTYIISVENKLFKVIIQH